MKKNSSAIAKSDSYLDAHFYEQLDLYSEILFRKASGHITKDELREDLTYEALRPGVSLDEAASLVHVRLIKLGEIKLERPGLWWLPIDKRHKPDPQETTPLPPANAEFILHLLLTVDERDALIGDLIERYAAKHERFGEQRANLWFYSQVLRSLWPLLKRCATKAGGLLALSEWIRRHVS